MASDPYRTATVTIPAGDSVSGPFDMDGVMQILRIDMPPAWTPAAITFLGAQADHVYRDIANDGGDEEKVAVGANKSVGCSPALWGVRFARLRSGTAEAPVPQEAARTITVVMALAPDLAPTVVVNVPPSGGS